MEIFYDTDDVMSDIYDSMYSTDVTICLLNLCESRDNTSQYNIMDDDNYFDGSVDAALKTKNMR